MSVQEHLESYREKLKKESDNIKDEKKRLESIKRISEKLLFYNGADKVISSDEIVEYLSKHPLPDPIPYNFEKLDDILGGLYPGTHVIVGAQPKNGKTEFLLELVRRTREHNPLFLALEQSPFELVNIMQERNLDIPYFYAPKMNIKYTIDWLEERISESWSKHNTKVVYIDHFGYLKSDRFHQGGFDMTIVDMLQRIRNIAKELGITIVTSVHTTKLDPTTIPTSDNLKGSAGFRQEADVIMMLWREAYYEGKELHKTNKTLVSIQENRRKSKTGNFRIKMEKHRFIQDDNITFEYEKNNGQGSFGAFD